MHKEVCMRIAPSLFAATLLLSGCATETLFRSKFTAAQVGQPPTTAEIGTVTTSGAVMVIDAPVSPSGKWVQMARPVADTAPAVYQGGLSAVRGDGRYTFSATVLMPKDTQVATIEFASAAGDGFLHLDLMPNDKVRIDDTAGTEFGLFPRDKPFIVQVTLDIDDTPTAHIVLAGDGVQANSIADRAITLPPRILAAKQFGAVRLSMSFPHLGTLQGTNISVTRRKS